MHSGDIRGSGGHARHALLALVVFKAYVGEVLIRVGFCVLLAPLGWLHTLLGPLGVFSAL